MLPYHPARDGYPPMSEADDDVGSAIGATDLAPAVCTSTCKSTSGVADCERLRSALPKHCCWRGQAETRMAKEGSAIPRSSTVRSGCFGRRIVTASHTKKQEVS